MNISFYAPAANPARPIGTNNFRQLWAAGYRQLLPIVPPSAQLSPQSTLAKRLEKGVDARGKVPGIKNGLSLWQSCDWLKISATLELCDAWEAMGAGVGLRMGGAQNLLGLDIDSFDQAVSDLVEKAARDMLGSAPVRYGQRPKRLMLYRTTEPVAYKSIQFPTRSGKLHPKTGKPILERVEVLPEGKQCVWAPSIHPKTGRPYTVDGMVNYDQLAVITPQQIHSFFEYLARVIPGTSTPVARELSSGDAPANQAILKGDLELVRRAVAAIPNNSDLFPMYDDWRNVGYAIKAALPDHPREALELFAEWSDRWDDGENTAEFIAEKWMSFKPPFRIGASWLYELAEKTSNGLFRAVDAWFQPIATTAPTLFDLAPLEQQTAEPQGTRTPHVVTISGPIEAKAIPVREWLVHPWLPSKAVSALVGAPGVSKSTFGLCVALTVATGNEAILRGKDKLSGERLHSNGPVLVYNREDTEDEMQRRLAGLCAYHQVQVGRHSIHLASGTSAGRLVIVQRKERGPVVRAAGAAWLVDQIRALRPVLVVLDPLVSLSSGLDENSNDDMEALLAELRTIASAEQTTILVVHHSGKNGKDGKLSGDMAAARGASAIMGAVRGGLTLTAMDAAGGEKEGALIGLPAGRYVVAEGVKANYAVKAAPVVYRLKQMHVGNGSGDPLPACGELLFDDEDAAAFLRRSGDTVAVHEIVDCRDAATRAAVAEAARRDGKRTRVAEIVKSIMGDAPEVVLNDVREQLTEELIAAGLTAGQSVNSINNFLHDKIGEDGVEIENNGQDVRITFRNRTTASTSPLVLRQYKLSSQASQKPSIEKD
jgi:hypothetical protein